jgi:hypothetical protein
MSGPGESEDDYPDRDDEPLPNEGDEDDVFAMYLDTVGSLLVRH